jgi:ribonuclease VapC
VILDSSAIVAVVLREPEFDRLLDQVGTASIVAIGAPTLAETGIVLRARLGTEVRGLLARLLQEWQAVVVPFGQDHWQEALDAYSRFGRGRHKAALNFGDCLSYAVARVSGQPLLCTGRDFAKTDLPLVRY